MMQRAHTCHVQTTFCHWLEKIITDILYFFKLYVVDIFCPSQRCFSGITGSRMVVIRKVAHAARGLQNQIVSRIWGRWCAVTHHITSCVYMITLKIRISVVCYHTMLRSENRHMWCPIKYHKLLAKWNDNLSYHVVIILKCLYNQMNSTLDI